MQTIKFKRYMVFGEKERTYHETTNICHICKNMPDSKSRLHKLSNLNQIYYVILIKNAVRFDLIEDFECEKTHKSDL